MPIIRAQVSFGADLPDVRHRFVITPHFESSLAMIEGTDWQALCDDINAVCFNLGGNSRETQTKLYDAEEAAPNYPKATKTAGLGVFPTSTTPREIALCLSYRGGDGPRKRGRLYIPSAFLTTASIGLRPASVHQTKLVEFAAALRGIGGANVQWGVWSRSDREFSATDTAYVDNEWDVVRSRGLPATSRVSAGDGS